MDVRLSRVLHNQLHAIATLHELAVASSMAIDEVVSALGGLLDRDAVGIEAADGELFLLTNPKSGTGPSRDVAVGLWETLRKGRDVKSAARVWRVMRFLERAGWGVVPNPGELLPALGTMPERIDLAVTVRGMLVGAVDVPDPTRLARGDGVLAHADQAGLGAIALLCAERQLEPCVTASREFHLTRVVPSSLTVMVLEAPRFQPVIVARDDTSVRAVSVTAVTPAALQ